MCQSSDTSHERQSMHIDFFPGRDNVICKRCDKVCILVSGLKRYGGM